jgi:hypothetical protein
MMFHLLLAKGAPRVFAALANVPSVVARHLSIGIPCPR